MLTRGISPSGFRRLTRHFAAGLVDNDLIADGQDLHASIAGVLAAFLVGSACVALMFLGKYNSVVATVHGALTAQFRRLPTNWRWRSTTRRCCSAAR